MAPLTEAIVPGSEALGSGEDKSMAISIDQGQALAISFAPSGDPEAPPSLMLTGFSCLYVGFLLGTKFDPLNPFVGIGGANKEDGEYRTKDEAVEILGRRGIDAWPGLLIGISMSLLAMFLVEFR